MTKTEAVEYFKKKIHLARALKVDPASVSAWGEKLPKLRQLQLEDLTNGDLKADPDCRPRNLDG